MRRREKEPDRGRETEGQDRIEGETNNERERKKQKWWAYM